MRIAYVGNFGPEYSTENDLRRAFQALGHGVVELQENGASPKRVREEALRSDLLLWTSTWDGAQPLSETLRTLGDCNDAGVATATYHLDRFWGLDRDGRQWQANPMMYMEHVCTADGMYEDEWRELLTPRASEHHWVRPGVRHDACGIGSPRTEYVCDVAFVGSDGRGYHREWQYRRKLVDYLEGVCKANDWRFLNPGGRQPKVSRGQDLNDFYASARVVVGDSLCLHGAEDRYWSDRVYETTGRGGCLVMPYIEPLHHEFGETIGWYEFGDFAELVDTIRSLLDHPERRAKMRSAATHETMAKHTYVSRARELLAITGLTTEDT